MLALLPDGVIGTYASVDFDAETGANTLTDFRLASEENPDVGISISEMIIWGFQPAMLEQRLAGTNFDQRGRLLQKMEARDISLFGAEAFYERLNDAYANSVLDASDNLVPDEYADDFNEGFKAGFTTVEELDLTAGKLIMQSIELRPYERLPRIDFSDRDRDDADRPGLEDDDFVIVIEYLRDIAAFYRSVGAERISLEELNYDFKMSSDVQDVSMQMAFPLVTIENWEGGDIGRMAAGNVQFSAIASVDGAEDTELDGIPAVEMSGTFGNYFVEDMELDAAYRYLAMGEMPPNTETDLMSLGVWTLEDMNFSILGSEFYSIGKSVTDLSDWHWLIPTRVSVDVDRLSYNLSGFMENAAQFDPTFRDDEDLTSFLDVLPVLGEYGLGRPVMDVDGGWSWDAENGPVSLSFSYGLQRYGAISFVAGGSLPIFEDAAAALEANGPGALGGLLTRDASITGGAITLEDKGGVDNALALAIEIAKVLPSDGGLDITNMTPDGLKAMALGGLSFASAQAAQVFPPAVDYAESLSDFITLGGTLTVSLDPQQPLAPKDLAKLSELVGDPDSLVSLLGLSVEHSLD
ncbi:MAG: hypothetical protein AAF583_04015 [Pseudomonadota bacterium]